MAQISTEIQSLSPSATMELFVIDMTNLQGGTITRFHAGVNELNQPVVWQGYTYIPLPIEASGFDITTKGALPRPKIRIANVNGILSKEVSANDDLVGCKLIRKRTMVKYLDAVNFPSGVNPDADPNQHFPDDLWFIDRKMMENRYVIEWELASVFDLQGVMLPYRQVIQNSCPWIYRSAECGWMGGYFDKADQPCDQAHDFCPKRLSSCRVRFADGNLPFGGFPGATQYG